jgi:hypothetical protein
MPLIGSSEANLPFKCVDSKTSLHQGIIGATSRDLLRTCCRGGGHNRGRGSLIICLPNGLRSSRKPAGFRGSGITRVPHQRRKEGYAASADAARWMEGHPPLPDQRCRPATSGLRHNGKHSCRTPTGCRRFARLSIVGTVPAPNRPGMANRMACRTDHHESCGAAKPGSRGEHRWSGIQAVSHSSNGTPDDVASGALQRLPVNGKRLTLFNATWPGSQGLRRVSSVCSSVG